ncbi:MAG TPA: ribonuclease [Brevundimonas sp.]|uniref:ribonuclease n=1 Tax=Brevundimonas sp. TaxID=1871086 RepID=UPI002ED91613
MSETRTEDAREAEAMGEKPDLGQRADALTEALSGSDMGSDTRAGSLQGGAAPGSEDDPDQDSVNENLASEGMTDADAPSQAAATAQVNNTGADLLGPGGDPVEGKRGDADAASG